MDYLEMMGVPVPVLGFGTWDLRGTECQRSLLTALEIGYRNIDTAEFYDNEQEVGWAIRESGIDREKIFLTTKVWSNHLHREACRESLENSLKKLGTEWVDLFLIHWPNQAVPLEETLGVMNDLVEAGKTRFIGVSNFSPSELTEAIALSPAPIVTNQVEYHPLIEQTRLLDSCREQSVILTAYCPLARGRIMRNPLIQQIANRYEKTPAQVTLRWLIQQEQIMAIPKAAKRLHQQKNLDIFDFRLTTEEMGAITALSAKKG